MKIVFMGTPDYATYILNEILKANIEVLALVTMPDRPVGRKLEIKPPHIKEFVLHKNLNIPIFQPTTLKDRVFQEKIKELKPDFLVVAAYGMMLPKEILNIATSINLHASILPRHRGASPIQESILTNDSFFGITAMLMDIKLDAGEILGMRYIKNSGQRIEEIWNTLSLEAGKLCVKILQRFLDSKPLKQYDCISTYCKKIDKKSGETNLENVKKLYLQYLAYSSWPGVFLTNGIKLKSIELINVNTQNKVAGVVINIGKGFFDMTCLEGSIRIHKIQPPSKNETDGESFIRGRRLNIGDTIF